MKSPAAADVPDEAPMAAPVPRSRLKLAKLGVLGASRRAGLFEVARQSAWRSHRLLILAYHGVSFRDEHEFAPDLFIPVDALRRRFTMLRDGGYNVLPLREALERAVTGTLPRHAVALTFDDGMHDFAEAAVPLLREFGFPATVYVTTYYAAKEVPAFQLSCRYLLWAGRGRQVTGTDLTTAGTTLDLVSLDSREQALELILEGVTARDGGIPDQVETLRRLASRVDVDFDRFLAERRQRLMTPGEIGDLPQDLVEVQLHTHRHRVPLRRDAFTREIDDNRAALAGWRPGVPLDAFCYPSGVTDPRFLPWLRELGIASAVTCEPGLVSRSTDPLMLPRVVDSWLMTQIEFEGWLTGLSAFLPRVPRRGRYRPKPVND